MKTTEPTIGKQPLTGWSSRLPTATLDLRGRHEQPTIASRLSTIRALEDAAFEQRLEKIAWLKSLGSPMRVG